jgi:hypothetical protein
MKTKTLSRSGISNKDPLIGRFFHSVEDGRIKWQGLVIGSPVTGWYLVQLFEWLMGEPNVQTLVGVEEMRSWLFYETNQQMIDSSDHGVAREGGKYRPNPIKYA